MIHLDTSWLDSNWILSPDSLSFSLSLSLSLALSLSLSLSSSRKTDDFYTLWSRLLLIIFPLFSFRFSFFFHLLTLYLFTLLLSFFSSFLPLLSFFPFFSSFWSVPVALNPFDSIMKWNIFFLPEKKFFQERGERKRGRNEGRRERKKRKGSVVPLFLREKKMLHPLFPLTWITLGVYFSLFLSFFLSLFLSSSLSLSLSLTFNKKFNFLSTWNMSIECTDNNMKEWKRDRERDRERRGEKDWVTFRTLCSSFRNKIFFSSPQILFHSSFFIYFSLSSLSLSLFLLSFSPWISFHFVYSSFFRSKRNWNKLFFHGNSNVLRACSTELKSSNHENNCRYHK